jgi:uridine kinase
VETVADYQTLCERVRSLVQPQLVGVEGFTGSGKSRLSNVLASELSAVVIHSDNYVLDGDATELYCERLNCDQLALALIHARATSRLVLVEGICLRETLRRLGQSAAYFIYVKRVAGNHLWHDGFHLEDFETRGTITENRKEPHRSDFAYHSIERPHEKADIVFLRVEEDEV